MTDPITTSPLASEPDPAALVREARSTIDRRTEARRLFHESGTGDDSESLVDADCDAADMLPALCDLAERQATDVAGERQISREHAHHVAVLIAEIHSMAKRAGIANDVPIDGPMAIQLLEDMGEEFARIRSRLFTAERVLAQAIDDDIPTCDACSKQVYMTLETGTACAVNLCVRCYYFAAEEALAEHGAEIQRIEREHMAGLERIAAAHTKADLDAADALGRAQEAENIANLAMSVGLAEIERQASEINELRLNVEYLDRISNTAAHARDRAHALIRAANGDGENVSPTQILRWFEDAKDERKRLERECGRAQEQIDSVIDMLTGEAESVAKSDGIAAGVMCALQEVAAEREKHRSEIERLERRLGEAAGRK